MFERLSEYLDGELDDVTCREIQHHVRECIPCEVCFNTLKRTVELCREAESVPVPESFSLRLKEIVQSLARGEIILDAAPNLHSRPNDKRRKLLTDFICPRRQRLKFERN